jgi:phosphatidylinositol kinase/protein kinase (PI-3  family)
VKTTAIWSIIGYVIGLGDRHGDNILIHQHTGEVTHVDFDCIFEKGARLKVPEIVPFRLTSNIIDAFGIFKEKGVFQKCAEVVLRVMRKNQKNIISYLDSFKHDPLQEMQTGIRVEINDALEVIEKKLTGNINIDSGAALTVEEQVEQVILNAISDDSLSKMYIGWMPWL